MTRNYYWVISYGKDIEKMYKNYKSAEKLASKMIQNGILCGVYCWKALEGELECVYGDDVREMSF